jgi:hypothetical protein
MSILVVVKGEEEEEEVEEEMDLVRNGEADENNTNTVVVVVTRGGIKVIVPSFLVTGWFAEERLVVKPKILPRRNIHCSGTTILYENECQKSI